MKRKRTLYTFLVLVVILFGLGSRRYPMPLPSFVTEYAGDTLWALMVFLIIGLCWPKRSSLKVAFFALLFSYAIEISQLYHDAWIDAIRDTTLGSLVLGHVFVWSDLLCYTVGVTIGFLFELVFMRLKLSAKRDMAQLI